MRPLSPENKQRNLLLLALALIFLGSFFMFNRWQIELEGGDPLGYYIHLPSSLLYHDVGDYSKSMEASERHYRKSTIPGKFNMIPDQTPIGKRSVHWPVGVAILTLPFFAVAHIFCLLSGLFPTDGFSTPYLLMAGLAAIFYVMLGFFLLFGILRRFFTLETSIYTVLTIGLATNLFYFTGYHNYMAHPFLFALVCLLIDRTIRFWDAPGLKNAIWIGVAVGLIAVTRLHDIITVLIPVLWSVQSGKDFVARMQFFMRKIYWLLAALISGLVALSPQLLYYKVVSGRWWWYAYGDEKFDFIHPQILGGLTDYKNGWLIYTPVMALALMGIFWMRRYVKSAFLPLLILLPLHIYISYSWWCWYYINGYGSRPMIDLYGMMALPLAAFIQVMFGSNWKKWVLIPVLLFFAWLNIFQVWQFENGILWSQFENRAHFWSVFGKTYHTKNDLIEFESNARQPEFPLKKIRLLAMNDLEDTVGVRNLSDLKHSGNFAVHLGNVEFGGTVATQPGQMQDVRPGDWIRTSVWAYTKSAEKTWIPSKLAVLVLTMQDESGKTLRYRKIRVASKVGNDKGNLYSSGDPDRWGEAAYFVRVPANFPANGSIKAYVWNPDREKITIDDLSVELYRKE
jgi:hypothetical protein